MKPVHIIGMGMSPADLTAAHLERIRAAEVLVGGERHLAHFADLPVEKKAIDRNLKALVEFIRHRMADRSVVVLASGDPLFFGIGSYLANELGHGQVVIHPNVSAPAAAFARLREPWQGVPVVSLHGRKGEAELLRVLGRHRTVAVYTDPRKNPARVAGYLLENGLPGVRMCVLEDLGGPAESVSWLSLREAAAGRFRDPNIVVLKHETETPAAAGRLHLGTAEEVYVHGRGLITKAEVRAVTLAKLRLAADHVFWDLGAGSGSVAIEASLFVTRGRIYAVEKSAERLSQIEENRRRFGVPNLEIVAANLPEGLEPLPDPDRVFIGGGGRDLEAIIRAAAGRLRPRGILVINTVLVESVQTALAVLEELGHTTELVQIQVSRDAAMPYGRRLAAENPVWVVRGEGDFVDS
jgi:precorrin-6Y C5,15-methyltransferase (decarboxylating)